MHHISHEKFSCIENERIPGQWECWAVYILVFLVSYAALDQEILDLEIIGLWDKLPT